MHTGAGYRIEVPANWNGDLVVWAHGFAGTGLELIVDNHPLREFLIATGYAWAASSYRRNDYDVTSGVQDTHALTNRFNGIVGKPDRVYLTGASMGGHVTAVAIEQYPKTYDGALPVCGVLGDFELFDYFFDFNVAAQQIGTGSSIFPVDPFVYIGLTVPTIKANLESFSGGWPIFLNADGTNLKTLTELRSGENAQISTRPGSSGMLFPHLNRAPAISCSIWARPTARWFARLALLSITQMLSTSLTLIRN